MRVVVAGHEPDLWIQPLTHINEKAQVLRWLKDDAVISMTEEDWGQVRTRLAQVCQADARAETYIRLLDILMHAPMSGRVSQPPVDTYLDAFPPIEGVSQLGITAADDHLADLLRDRRSAVKVARTRNAVYHLAIRPLASTARKVRFLDPWAATDISKGREGVSWVVQQLYNDGIEEIEILSSRDDFHLTGVDEAKLEQVWKENARPGVTLRLVIADQVGDAHDRHMRFFYADGKRSTPVVVLGRGLSVFNYDRFSTPPTITDDSLNADSASEREQVILQSRRRKRVFEWPPKAEQRASHDPLDARRQ